MNALGYEMLLRKAYHCKKDYRNGADADIYRKMERAHNNLEISTSYSTPEGRNYEFQKFFAPVKGNVINAIETGIKEITAPKDIIELNDLLKRLISNYHSIDELDDVIGKAGQIFDCSNLKIGADY